MTRASFVHRPEQVLRVSVTGPTKVDGLALSVIVTRVLRILALEGARIVMISCVAEGMDQIGAGAAHERQSAIWAIVPARRESYGDRIKDAEARERYRQLTRAPDEPAPEGALSPASVVLELDMPFPPGDDECSRGTRQFAYREANMVMLQHTDLLLAVIRTDEGAAPIGGATSTLRLALDKQIPVVVIRPRHEPDFIVLQPSSIGARELVPAAIERLFAEASAQHADPKVNERALSGVARMLLGRGNGLHVP